MKTVDLFSGCGGLSLGLQLAGFNVVAAYENWEPAISIYKSNFQHPVHDLDLSKVQAAIAHIEQYEPEMISGGPPCQDFSSAGKRDEKGGRGDLTICFAHIVAGISPKWFIMENVDRIHKAEIFARAKRIFAEAGYGLTEIILDASFCGVPQRRKRMFLIGKMHSDDNFLYDILVARMTKEPLTVREYFGESLGIDYYYRHARSYARRGIFSVDEPSPTIRGVNRPIPPDYKPHKGDATKDLRCVRPLSSLERALIQTFPRNFHWSATNKSTLEQIIGNAVPVNLAKFVGRAILDYEGKSSQLRKQRSEGCLVQQRVLYS
jgi:DNA (cytosine-5)-methyltransferase 1